MPRSQDTSKILSVFYSSRPLPFCKIFSVSKQLLKYPFGQAFFGENLLFFDVLLCVLTPRIRPCRLGATLAVTYVAGFCYHIKRFFNVFCRAYAAGIEPRRHKIACGVPAVAVLTKILKALSVSFLGLGA